MGIRYNVIRIYLHFLEDKIKNDQNSLPTGEDEVPLTDRMGGMAGMVPGSASASTRTEYIKPACIKPYAM